MEANFNIDSDRLYLLSCPNPSRRSSQNLGGWRCWCAESEPEGNVKLLYGAEACNISAAQQ
ncbi:hypothetical protein H6F88_00070 [Oculatella sp. FACHB-28]|uniref:hypothetical protein n=1 Tax=Oculatella sp. FACHB-28 TaxID=2692845 RepID=UPI001683709F|nr:hypothetical protein [Oculatella sp. FACHB-28]MBD2054449.1 hypothetical protein [Oculatella sp. FACHB-28]